MNADQPKHDSVPAIEASPSVHHFAISNQGVFELKSGPSDFLQFGFGRMVSPARTTGAVGVTIGLGDPSASPIAFAFGFFVAVGDLEHVRICWVVRDTSFECAVAGLREACCTLPHQLNEEQVLEISGFLELLHVAVTGENP